MIDCYNKKINIPSSILLLMDDIWNLSQGLNIYVYHHVYKEGNKIADCLAKRGLNSLDYNVCWSNFLKNVTNINFHYYCGFYSKRLFKFFV